MSDTPETDALISVGLENADRECVTAEFARKLERERDEALDELAEEMKFHHRTHSQLVNANCKMLDNQNDVMQLADRLTALELHSTSELARLERERDEAREELSAVWQSLRDSQDEVLRLTLENRELRNLSNEQGCHSHRI